MRKLKLILLLIACTLAMVSCERKDLLEPGHRHGNRIPFNILMDIKTNVATGVYFDSLYYSNLLAQARSLTVISYPLNLDVPVETHELDSLGGEIWLLPGSYHILAYTSDFYDLDGIFYYNMKDPFEAEAKTNQVLKTKDDDSNVKSYDISEPDPLFATLMENVTIIENKDTTLTATLDPLAYRYWFEVDVDGLDYITEAYLKIDGMYTSVYLASGKHNADEYASQKIPATIHKDENKIKGEFLSFGPHQDDQVKNSMILTFINGRTISVQLDDISPEIKRLVKGGEIIITQKIVINVGDDGSGFDPVVEDWDEEYVEIPI